MALIPFYTHYSFDRTWQDQTDPRVNGEYYLVDTYEFDTKTLGVVYRDGSQNAPYDRYTGEGGSDPIPEDYSLEGEIFGYCLPGTSTYRAYLHEGGGLVSAPQDTPNSPHCGVPLPDPEPDPDPAPAPVGGCRDPDATNYDPAATFDDGTCVYTPVLVEPVFSVPLLNCLRFVQPATPDNCVVFETEGNTLFCQQDRPEIQVRPRYYQKVAFCDELPLQVLTNYQGGVQALVQRHRGGQTLRTVDFERVLPLTGEATTDVVLSAQDGYTRLDAPAEAGPLPANLLRARRVRLGGAATGSYRVRTAALDATTGAPYLVLSRPYAAAAGAVTATWQRVGPGYDAWQAVLTLAGLPAGEYQVLLLATDARFEPAEALSEPLLLREQLPGTVCVDYGHGRNAFGLLFSTGIQPRLRVEGSCWRLKPAGSSTVHRSSSGAPVLLGATAQRQLVLSTWGLPDYLHEKLALICRLELLRVNGQACLGAEGAYEKTDQADYPLSPGAATLEQLGWLAAGALPAGDADEDEYAYLAANGQLLNITP